MLLIALCLAFQPARAHAQAADGVLSEKEVEDLREANYEPELRLLTFERILNDRERILDDTWQKRRGHADQADDLHDVIDQIGAIADELNDNLDAAAKNHRDVRKALPKLIAATERWSTSLRTPVPNEAYDVVRKIALDNLKDTRELAQQLGPDLDLYFKAHPEALKQEKARRADPHAVSSEGPPLK